MTHPFDRARAVLARTELSEVRGKIQGSVGLTLHAFLPGARRGDVVCVHKRSSEGLYAEVIAFSGEDVVLLPLGDALGVGPDDPVTFTSDTWSVRCSEALLSRVLNGLGAPIDGAGTVENAISWPIRRAAPPPLSRPRITRTLPTKIRGVDALTTIGEGQRIGVFAPAGVGKTTLLSEIAQNAEVDVTVICLIGERGRELNDWLDHCSAHGRARSVFVCATSDEPALVRVKSAHVATSIAEYFREQGKRVLLIVDSLTRLVRAAREVGLSAGEPPLRRGFPPSAFSDLAPLIERAGLSPKGSITAFYSVLVEGNDLDEPVSDEAKGLLDGHLVLSRALAERGRFPALDVTHSLSRVMDDVIEEKHREKARSLRELITHYEHKRELVELGAYSQGSDKRLDQMLNKAEAIERFLSQRRGESTPFSDMLSALFKI